MRQQQQRQRRGGGIQRRRHDIALLPHHEMRFGNSKLEIIIIHMDRQTGRQVQKGGQTMAWYRAVWHEMRLRWLHEVAPGESVVAWVKSISLGGDLAKMPNVFALPPFVYSFFPHLLCIQYTHICTYVPFLHSLCQLINFSYFPLLPPVPSNA